MKNILMILFSALLTIPAYANQVPEIGGAKIEGSKLKVSVKYWVACEGKHPFKFELGNCTKSQPAQCKATLKDEYISETACRRAMSQKSDIYEFSLADLKVPPGASVTISGAKDSKATFTFPGR